MAISNSNNTSNDSTQRYYQLINTKIRFIVFFAAKEGKALVLYSQQKQDLELTMAQIISSLLQNSGLN